MKVHVTQEHIDKGQPKSILSCAIALAVKDSIRPSACVAVFSGQIAIQDRRGAPYPAHGARFPPFIYAWINRFDRGEKVQPVSFEVFYKEGVEDSLVREEFKSPPRTEDMF